MIAQQASDIEASVYDAVSIRLVLRRETAINLDAMMDELGLELSVITTHVTGLIQAGLVEVIAPVAQDAARYDSSNTFFRWKRPGEEFLARDRQEIG